MANRVETYEQRFGALLGEDQAAVAFSFARTALRATLTALGLQPGDEVVLSPLTCKVVPLTLLSLALKPVYADVDPGTLNLCPDAVAAALGPATGAILFQHTYGHSAGLGAVHDVAAKHGLPLVEDRAQGLPYTREAGVPGLHGKAALFSNNARKPLPAGSGGLAVTPDAHLADGIRAYRDRLPHRTRAAEQRLRLERWVHRYVVRPRLYWPLYELNRRLDANYRTRPVEQEIKTEITDTSFQISTAQANAGLRWLDRLAPTLTHRIENARAYTGALASLATVTVPFPTGDEPLYYVPVLTDHKETLLAQARKQRVELIAWPVRTPIFPIEAEEILPAYGYRPGSCPAAEAVARRLVGLPTDPSTHAQTRARMIALLTQFDSAYPNVQEPIDPKLLPALIADRHHG